MLLDGRLVESLDRDWQDFSHAILSRSNEVKAAEEEREQEQWQWSQAGAADKAKKSGEI